MTITMKMFIYPVHYDKKTKLTSLKKANIGFFQIKSQKFDFQSKYWPFSTVLLIKL